MFRIHIGLSANPDPAIYLSAAFKTDLEVNEAASSKTKQLHRFILLSYYTLMRRVRVDSSIIRPNCRLELFTYVSTALLVSEYLPYFAVLEKTQV